MQLGTMLVYKIHWLAVELTRSIVVGDVSPYYTGII